MTASNLYNEIDLIKASQQGDTAAFETIVKQYESLICAMTFSATSNLTQSEELAQETFVYVWQNLSQLKDPSKFRYWIISINRNVIRNSFRKTQRDILSSAAPLDQIHDATVKQRLSSNIVITSEQQVVIKEALEKIPEKYREPLVLYYREGQSIQSVAQQLDLSETAVHTRLSRGRKKLKKETETLLETTIGQSAPGKTFASIITAMILSNQTSGMANDAILPSEVMKIPQTGTMIGSVKSKIITATTLLAATISIVWVYNTLNTDQPETSPKVPLAPVFQVVQEEKPTMSPVNENRSNRLRNDDKQETKLPQKKSIPKTSINTDNKKLDVQEETAPAKEDYQFVPKGMISGLITDAHTGKPIVNGELQTYPVFFTTETDENGFYSFDSLGPDGYYSIGTNIEGYIQQMRMEQVWLENGKSTVLHIPHIRAGIIDVMVVDEEGTPVIGAEVYRYGTKTYGKKLKWGIGALTKEDGVARLRRVHPNDTYVVLAFKTNLLDNIEKNNDYQLKYLYAPVHMELPLYDTREVINVTLMMPKGKRLHGTLYYQDGQPVSGARMMIEPDWWCIKQPFQICDVGPDGRFTLKHIAPQKYDVKVQIQGDQFVGKEIEMSIHLPPNNDKPLELILPIESPKDVATIRGTLSWVGPNRPEGIVIKAHSSAHGVYTSSLVSPDIDHFAINGLKPGNYQVKVKGINFETVVLDNVQAPSHETHIDLITQQRPKISFQVIDNESQEPIVDGFYRFRHLDRLTQDQDHRSNQWTSFHQEESSDNQTNITRLPQHGVYQLQVRADGFIPTWSKAFHTEPNELLTIPLYQGGASLKGRVVDEKSKPIQNATVRPLSLASGTSTKTEKAFMSDYGKVTTDSNGEFILTGLTPGNETLKIEGEDYTQVILKDIKLTTGQTRDDVLVVMKKESLVMGVAYDHLGLRQPNAIIQAQTRDDLHLASNDPAVVANAVASPEGYFIIHGLPEEITYFVRKEPWNSLGVKSYMVVPKPGHELFINSGDEHIFKGQIVLDQQPLANQKILLGSAYRYDTGVFRAFAQTDSQGHFVFRGIDPGKYGIYFQASPSRLYPLSEFELIDEQPYDLQVIPSASFDIHLTVQDENDAPWDIQRIDFMKRYNPIYSNVPYTSLTDPNNYLRIDSMTAGSYSMTLQRSDQLRYTHAMEILEERWIDIPLPISSSSVYGSISLDITTPLILQSSDQRIEVPIVKDKNGHYQIESLPEGEYRLGYAPLIGKSGYSFYLYSDQDKEINVDQALIGRKIPSTKIIVSILEDTFVLYHANAYLSHNGNVIEAEYDLGWQKTFKVLPGTYTLHVEADGFKSIEKSITIDPFKNTRTNDQNEHKELIRLEPW